MKNQKGFTLIELLIVIGIIAILAAAVIIAINPGQQFEQARNSTRRSHMNAIANAVYSYSVENNGEYPDCIEDDVDSDPGTEIGDTSENWTDVSDCFGTDGDLTSYMSEAPNDPDDNSDYTIRTIDGSMVEISTTSDEWSEEDNVVQ